MDNRNFPAVFLIVVFGMISVSPTNYYVSPSGNDANDGSISSPWQHIAFATCGGTPGCSCTTVNPHLLTAGDTLFIRGGTYHEHQIQFKNTGTKTAPICIKSYPGEWATINGDSVAANINGSFVFGLGMFIGHGNNWFTFDSLHVINGFAHNFEVGFNYPCTSVVIKNCVIENHVFNPGDNCAGVELTRGQNAYDDTVMNCIIIGNKHLNQNYCGVQMMGGDGIAVLNNEVSGVTSGIWYKHRDLGQDGVFRPCNIRNNLVKITVEDGYGICVSNNNTFVKNNIVVDEVGTGLAAGIDYWLDAGGPQGSHGRIEHNTVYNCRYTMLLNWGAGIPDTTITPTASGAMYDTTVNNVFWGRHAELGTYALWPYTYDTALTNNPPHDSSNYNLYWNTATSNVMYQNKHGYTLAQWIATQYPTYDAHSIQGQPTFANTSGTQKAISDFKLLPGNGYRAASDGTDMGADVSLVGTSLTQISAIKSTPHSLNQKGIAGLSGNGYIGIYDMKGTLIKKVLRNNLNIISLRENLKTGMYLLVDGRKQVRKISIIR